jgi:hypothetical protein
LLKVCCNGDCHSSPYILTAADVDNGDVVGRDDVSGADSILNHIRRLINDGQPQALSGLVPHIDLLGESPPEFDHPDQQQDEEWQHECDFRQRRPALALASLSIPNPGSNTHVHLLSPQPHLWIRLPLTITQIHTIAR